MEKIKYSAFDLFAYAMPGVFLQFGLFLMLNRDIRSLYDIPAYLKDMDLILALIILVAGYILGFSFYRVGVSLRTVLGFRIWKEDRSYDVSLSNTEKLVLVREHCQENFRYIQTWFLISGMSANLAVGSILLAAACILKIIQFGVSVLWHWSAVLAILLFMAFFQLEKSVMYMKWANREMNQTVISFGLQDKTVGQ